MTDITGQNPDSNQTSSNPPPLVLFGIACLVCLPLIYFFTSPLISFLHARWAEHLHLALITSVPLSVTFILLYSSSWHSEFSRAKRILLTTLSSCLIFGIDLAVVAFTVIAICLVLGLVRVVGGN